MIRFIFYLAFGYIIIKILKIFIDPVFDQKPSRVQSSPKATPVKEEKKSTLGDYVEFEEVNGN